MLLLPIRKKISILQKNASVPLRGYLSIAIGQKRLLLPEGHPPFKPAEIQGKSDLDQMLYNFFRQMPLFQNGSLPPTTRQRLFVEILEQIDPDDANFLIQVAKDQILPTGLTEDIIRKAFPDLGDK